MPILENPVCLACGGTHLEKFPAQFADFIALRVFEGENRPFHLLRCSDCGFAFYDYRFSNEEAARLYRQYRKEEYQQQRQQCETWYSRKINSLLGDNPAEIALRKQDMQRFIQPFLRSQKMTLLDFGGDQGQMIPPFAQVTENYVYDISAKNPVPGVTALSSLPDCRQKGPFDLILCNHVLEHLAEPAEVIREICSLLKEGGLLYLELPFDSPFYGSFLNNLQYLWNPHFKWKDIWIHFWKNKNRGYYAMHEHINFFTLAAARALLEKNGLCVDMAQQLSRNTVLGKGFVLALVAHLPERKK